MPLRATGLLREGQDDRWMLIGAAFTDQEGQATSCCGVMNTIQLLIYYYIYYTFGSGAGLTGG